MREIKFRAMFAGRKRILPVESLHFFERDLGGKTFARVKTKADFEKGGWYSEIVADTNRLTSLDDNATQIPRVVLMQYTGLKDKNGVDIYEGDIVKGSYYAGYNIGIKRIIGSVRWTSASFKVNGVKQYEGTIVGLDGSYEVIGNIHEHPELLGDDQ